MIYKMDLKDSSDTMTFNLLETPIVDKDIEGAVDNVTLDGNQYTDYLYLKKQYIQKWAIMCPDEYDELRGFYTRQFDDSEVPSYRVYYGANVTRDYTLNGDYFQFNAEGIETGMTLSQLLGNAEQTTYSGKNLANYLNADKATNDTTLTFVDDGFRQVTTSAGFGTKLPITGLTASTTYTISWSLAVTSGTANKVVRVFEGTGQSVTYATRNQVPTGAGHLTFTTGASATSVNIWFYNGIPSAGDTTWTNIMLEKGSAATAYEPYVGGIPAPNPDYPQPISTVTGEQNVKVTGKNLLGLQDDTLTSNGVDFAINNGTITASGTTTAASYAENDNIIGDLSRNGNYPVYSTITEANSIELRAGTYTVSAEITKTGETSAGIAFGTGATMGARITGLTKLEALINDATGTYTKTATFTIAEGERLYVSTYYEGNATKKNVGFTISNIQLELGSTATAYEAYQGQDFEVNLGKNLLYAAELPKTQSNVTVTYQDGVFELSGTANASSNLYLLPYTQSIIHLEAGESLTYYLERVGGTSKAYFVTYFIPDDGSAIDYNWQLTMEASENSKKLVKTATKAGKVAYVQFFLNNGVEYNVQVKVLVQKGNISNPSWAEYFPPIELAKIGTYQDRIYKDDGKWYIEKQVGKMTLDGAGRWVEVSSGVFYTDDISDYSRSGNKPLSNNFTSTTNVPSAGAVVDGTIAFGASNLGTQNRFYVKNTTIGWTSETVFKQWLTDHPTIVYYALATPTTTEITDETLRAQLNFLASLYGGVNNISLVGTGAQGEMEVFIRDVMSVETDVVPEVPVRLTLTDDGVINACGCRRNVQLTMRETTE